MNDWKGRFFRHGVMPLCAVLFGFTLLVLLSCSGAMAGSKAKKVLIVGDDAYPPYSYVEHGEPKGIYVDILRRIFERMAGYDVTMRLMPYKRAMDMARRGEAFGVFPPYYKPRMRPYLGTYSDPILREEVVVICHWSVLSRERPKFPEDYKGLRFGNNLGFVIGGDDFWHAVRDRIIDLEEVRGTETNLRKLVNGRLDCYINDRLAILATLKRMEAEGTIANADALIKEAYVVSGQYAHLAFSGHVDCTDFVAKFNRELAGMRASGELDEIVRAHTE
ncbi:substrate-binding periplasmic protein [Pseudodesulfovibrio tunisiensis]|uniref:substrate-binding periplasmic protein n=1 Tax=Pseudodesulfovibrio tunisiensis TaxID=463192 RepID=UPI001FB39432|nr:transporter substrate-binding domain-containing protein [Pseudodesulfovibrio tunisiensis]